MGKVFIDMAMSLDDFVAGLNNEDAGLHDWYFAPEGSAPAVIDELLQSIGAMVLAGGRLASSLRASRHKVPHFVLTRMARPPVTHTGVMFSFIPSVEHILAEAQAAARGEGGLHCRWSSDGAGASKRRPGRRNPAPSRLQTSG